jgi:hypothetical protein
MSVNIKINNFERLQEIIILFFMQVNIDTNERTTIFTLFGKDIVADDFFQYFQGKYQHKKENIVVLLEIGLELYPTFWEVAYSLQLEFYQQNKSLIYVSYHKEARNSLKDLPFADHLVCVPTLAEALEWIKMDEVLREMDDEPLDDVGLQ